jgi:hypothetical protein
MMILKNKLSADDLIEMEKQEKQQGFLRGISADVVKVLEKFEHNYCVFKDGKLVAAFGVLDATDKRGVAWAVLSPDLRREMVFLHKKVKAALDGAHKYTRIEATIEKSFTAGIRWIELLGFKREGLLHKYGRDGSDHYMFARCYG